MQTPYESRTRQRWLIHDFAATWESAGRWLLGPHLLTDIVEFLRGKSLVANFSSRTEIVIDLPLPTVMDQITQTRQSVVYAVPEELRGRFYECCDEIKRCLVDSYDGELDVVVQSFRYRVVNTSTLPALNAELARLERKQIQMGREELWQIAAAVFGLPFELPKPAGIAS